METAKENFEPRNFIEELILEDSSAAPLLKRASRPSRTVIFISATQRLFG